MAFWASATIFIQRAHGTGSAIVGVVHGSNRQWEGGPSLYPISTNLLLLCLAVSLHPTQIDGPVDASTVQFVRQPGSVCRKVSWSSRLQTGTDADPMVETPGCAVVGSTPIVHIL